MRRALGAVLVLAAALVQVTWAPQLVVYGAFPNLILIAVVGVTWTFGVRTGLVWACVGGLLLDLASPGPLGPHALALLAGAYVTGVWVRNFDPSSVVQPAIAAALSTLIYSVVLVGTANTLGLPVPTVSAAVQLTVAAAAYNAVLTPLALLVLRRVRSTAHSKPLVR